MLIYITYITVILKYITFDNKNMYMVYFICVCCAYIRIIA